MSFDESVDERESQGNENLFLLRGFLSFPPPSLIFLLSSWCSYFEAENLGSWTLKNFLRGMTSKRSTLDLTVCEGEFWFFDFSRAEELTGIC